jgi:DNA-binding NarL/FixJ family response regulator
LLLLDGADAVLEKSADAAALLAARDALRVDSGLPHVVRDVASRARRGQVARATFGGESRAPLSVSAVQLGEQTAIVIDEPSAQALDELSLSAFDLTQREREVSRRIAAGESNQCIALTLGISLYTVKDHVRAVLLKTRCATRTELAARLRSRAAR